MNLDRARLMNIIKSISLSITIAIAGIAAISSSGAEPVTNSAFQSVDLTAPVVSSSFPQLTLNPAPSGIWKNEVGNSFRKGATEVGFSLGASLGSKILGSTDAHDFGLSKLYIGCVLSDVVAEDNWYQGNWELMGEVFGGGQFDPQSAYLVGLTPVLRYDFMTGTRWVPFFDIGAGATATDIGRPDLGGTFQFNLQTGPGMHWFISKNTALTFQYRFLHLSNAGMENPNHGVNTSVFYAGVSWLF
jgi:hypothetical protein